MVLVEIYIDRKINEKELPEKITVEVDSGFFKKGEVIKIGDYTAIKVTRTTNLDPA